MYNPWHFWVINGYVPDLNTPLRPYMDRMAEHIAHDLPGTILLSGGLTHRKSFPGRSEARVMYDYLSVHPRIRSLGYAVPFFMEDKSYTTLENVQNVCKFIRATSCVANHLGEVKVTVGCEAQRALKVEILYRKIMPELMGDPKRLVIETSSWERANPLWEIPKIGFDLLALQVPALARWQRERMIRKSETR